MWAWRPLWSIVWLPVLLVVTAPWLALQWGADDAVSTGIQLAGVILQCAGMCLVALGVFRVVSRTNRPGVFRQWLRSIRPQTVSGGGTASITMTASARGRVTLGPGKSIDDRLAFVEREIGTLHDLIGKVENSVTEERDQRKQQISDVRRELGDQGRHFEAILADDYYTEIRGMWWIVAGIGLATVPGFFAPAWLWAFGA